MSRFASIALLIPVAMMLNACAAAEHAVDPYPLAGRPLPITVKVGDADGEAAGTIYYRAAGQGSYAAASMQARGKELWAELPTTQFPPGTSVEYYIDVERGSKFIALASAGEPYTVRLVDPMEHAVRKMRVRPEYGYAGQDIWIELYTYGEPIDAAEALYQAPWLPGEARATMWGSGDRYRLHIPGWGVREGNWQYAVIIWKNGRSFRLPEQGYDSLFVSTRPRFRERDRSEERR